MELEERLSDLERVHDWQGLVEELEKSVLSETSAARRAELHLKLGRVLEGKFLAGVRALKHFQSAYKLSPALVESLQAARDVYWLLGKLNMVQKLLELEIKATVGNAARTSALLLELGDVLCDEGEWERAASVYEKSVVAGGGPEATACLQDSQLDPSTWQEHLAALLRAANKLVDGPERARTFLRASRIARRFAPDEGDAMLGRAYAACPSDCQVGALYEGLFAQQGRLDELEREHIEALKRVDQKLARGRLAMLFGSRWVVRHQNTDAGTRFIEQALELDPASEPAFMYLREVYGTKGGDWQQVLSIAENARQHLDRGASAFLLAQSGGIAWRQLGDVSLARSLFAQLRMVAPGHPELHAFESHVGEPAEHPTVAAKHPETEDLVSFDHLVDDSVSRRSPSSAPPRSPLSPPPAEPPPPIQATHTVDERPQFAPVTPVVELAPAAPPLQTAPLADFEALRRPLPPSPTASATAPPGPAPHPIQEAPASDDRPTAVLVPRDPGPPEPPPQVDAAKIAELRQQAEKQAAARRYNEYVRTLTQLATMVPDARDKIAYYAEAADLYVSKFANQAEAVKAYESILSIDPNHSQAIDFLRQMYEKRRDWERLVALQRREAERDPAGPRRAARFLEIARLATERVKKPEACIELWQEVLAGDEANVEALAALASLYDRSKDNDRLAEVLEKQAAITSDVPTKIQVLTKLGLVYGDRLANDDGAVRAWRLLLTLDPNDRRAQDALKRKYIALGRWDDLEVFFADSGKWDEFIRLLEQQEAKETKSEAKVSLLFKIAELWAVKKQKLDRAAKAYEKVLEFEPVNLKAAEALIPIYTTANNHRALADAYEVKLGHEVDRSAKVALYRELAALYEYKIRDPQKAFERYLSAFELLASPDAASDDVERLAGVTERWGDVVAAYTRGIAEADSAYDSARGTFLRLRLGHVLLENMKRPEQALDVFRDVYKLDSDNRDAIAALERLYRQTGNFADLLIIYGKKRDLSSSPEEKRSISYEIAKLYQEELKDVDQAVDTYVEVLAEEPNDPQTLAALDALYARLGRWENHADVLRRRLELDVDEAGLVDLKYRLGQTLEKHLSDLQGALDCYREILFVEPGHEGARAALEAMLLGDLRCDAAGILESIYEDRGDWQQLIGVLQIRGAAEYEPAKRVSIKRKAARYSAEQLNDQKQAFSLLASALGDDPALAETRDEIERIAASAGWQRDLVRLFGELASSITDPVLARDYWLRIAAMNDHLGNVEEAAKAYYGVLSIEPSDGVALASLERLFTKAQRWDDLIGVIERRVEQTVDGAERESLLVTMASIQDQMLGRPFDAVASYKKVLELEPGSDRALRALDDLFTRQSMWSELADNLEAQLSLAVTDEARRGLMLRLASLHETRMGQVDAAIEGYREILEREPTNTEALAALERLGADPAHELMIADMLEPLYRHIGDWKKLIDVHELQVRCSDDSTRRVELLLQIAQIYEDAGADLGTAFNVLARALAEDPANETTQHQIERVSRATGKFADLARVFETLASKIDDPPLAATLNMMSARVHETDLNSVDAAVELYKKVLEIDPLNLVAAEAIERLFRTAERYQDLSTILQRKSEIMEDVSEKKDALFQAAAIEEDVLNRPEAAIAVYNRVLDIDSDDMRAIDALIRRHLDLSHWTELLAAYARKADLVVDGDDKKSIYYQVGAVYERELGDVTRAIDMYAKILELDPDDLQALSRLDVLYEKAQNWPELLSVLTREAEMTADSNEAISFQYRIGRLYEKHLEDVPRAVELFRELLERQPDHEPTLAALEALKDGESDPLGAAAVLEPIYEAASDWSKLIRVYEVQMRHAEDAYRKVELLHRIARLYEDALNNLTAAFDTYAAALPLDDMSDLTAGNIERLAMVVNRWPAVAELYDAEIEKLSQRGDKERLVELESRNADIFEVQLEDVVGAIVRHRRVLDADPQNTTALRSLDRLYQQTERWADLAAVLSNEADIADAPDDVLELKFRFGQVQQGKLGDLDMAIAAYREVMNAAPDHQATLVALEALFASGAKQMEVGEILEPLYRAACEWDKLVLIYEAQLSHTDGRENRLAAYYRLAELCEDRLLDSVRTLNVYIRALLEFPLEERVGDEASRLAASVDGGWETLANAYADVLSGNGDHDVQCVIGRRLARTFEEELGDVGKAEETYRYILGIDAKDIEALANLDRIHSAAESWTELARVLEMRVQAIQEASELVEVLARLGELYETRLNDTASAIRAYRRIFDDLDKSNEGAITALARIYEREAAWHDLDMVYQRELESASGDAAEAQIRARIAHLAAERLGQPEKAIETWKAVLDLRGEDSEALSALSDLYDSLGQWARLVDVLERLLDIAESDGARITILARRARTLDDKLGRGEAALDDYGRLLDIEYTNVDALRAIVDIRRAAGDPNELVAALHQMVDRASSLLERRELKELFRELGKTYGSALQQPYEAAEAWRRLLDVESDFEAMDALESIYRAEERWADVVSVNMQRAEALTDNSERIKVLRDVANIWREKIGEPDGARDAYQRILELDRKEDGAFLELEKLHIAASRWEPLIELYLARLETREGKGEQTALLRKIARVFEEKLEDKGQALDALVNALEIDFYDRETAKYLERLAAATGRWPEIIHIVSGWLAGEAEPGAQIRLCLLLAKWYGDDLGHPEYAQPYYAQIIQLDPHNVGAMRQLASLFEKSGDWKQMGATLTSALDVATNDIDRKEVLNDLGELLDLHMQQTEVAVTNFRRALDVDSTFLPALENLERIYAARGQEKELAEILQKKVLAIREEGDVAAVKLRLARLYETKLGETANAARVFREVVDKDPQNIVALRGLSRVYESLERWQELVEVLDQQVDVVTTERDKIDVLMRLATLQEERFLKAELAAQRLEQVLEIDPTNEDAYSRLERAYRRLRRWPELVRTYERHIDASLDRKTKVERYGEIAQVYAEELNDAEHAVEAYGRIVELDDGNVSALEALARLYEKTGDTAKSIDCMTRVADLTVDVRQRIDAFYHIGKALDEKLGDRVAAQERYEMVIDLEPSHLASLAALRQIAIDSGDFDKAARYLEQEQGFVSSPRQRAKLLVELGRLREEKLFEHTTAVAAWEAAYLADSENEDAARPLVDEYITTEQWAKALPLLEFIAPKSTKRDRAEQHDVEVKLGKVCAALGEDEKALKAYTAAYQLDVTDQEAIRGLADVCFRLKDWSAALSNYQKVLTALDEQESEARAEIYYRLGRVKQQQGQLKQATNNYEKALSIDPAHRLTLEALVGVYADLKDWKQSVAYRRQILDNVFDGEERLRMLNEIADVWAEQGKNPAKAIEALEEARELEPLNAGLLHKLIALYQATENWSKMIDTLQAIAESEKDPGRKSKFLYTMAQLYRDKEEDQDKAVELFNEALDLNPNYLEAFERINKLLTAKKDWKALERAFRKMLRRMSTANISNPELEFSLWHNLGLIYRDRLRDTTSAIESFKMATRYKPDEAVERQILAELYEATDQIEAAVGEHALVLQKDALRIEPYRSLYRLYTRMHDYDRAWCMCAALAFLRKTEEDEQRFFEDYRPKGMIQVKSRLDNEGWVRNLFHKDESIYIGKIFEMLTPAAIIAKTSQLKAKRQLPVLDRRFRQDPNTSTVTFAKTFGWAAQVLGIPVPELYVRNDVPGALVAVVATPPASVAGQTVLTGFTPQELTFIVGKHLSGYRGEHYIKNLFPTLNELKVILFAGVKIVIPEFVTPPEMAQAVNATAIELVKHMQPVQRESLRLVVQKWIEDGAKADLRRWMQATEITACRVGLLLCGDLEIAKKIIAAEQQLPGDEPPAEKVKEVLVFSVSEQYFALRKAIGIAIG
ncbi:MAG: tetratricopeptide repeat protein [Polyangiaceae bacterium]|jgi:tetratricopeptide (TPR) repeat protein